MKFAVHLEQLVRDAGAIDFVAAALDGIAQFRNLGFIDRRKLFDRRFERRQLARRSR